MVFLVRVALKRTVVYDSDWRFDNLRGSHHQSQDDDDDNFGSLKHQSLSQTTVLFMTTLTRTITLHNRLSLPGSNLLLYSDYCFQGCYENFHASFQIWISSTFIQYMVFLFSSSPNGVSSTSNLWKAFTSVFNFILVTLAYINIHVRGPPGYPIIINPIISSWIPHE